MGEKDIGKLFEKLDFDFLKKIGLDSQEEKQNLILCHKCSNWIGKKKIPNIHTSNGLELDHLPEDLNISDLEQQLLVRTLIFLKIKKLPKTG